MTATLTPPRRERERALLDAAPLADASVSRVVTAVSRTAWAQAVVRATASASNLSFAQTRIAVLGTGPLASELATRLGAVGARVVVVGDDPVALVEFAQRGVAIASTEAPRLGDAVLAFATGELAEPITARALGTGGPLLLVDAAETEPAVVALTDPSSGRPGIARLTEADREAFVLVAREIADGSARRTREALTARFARALHRATAEDPAASPDDLHRRADRALAEELLR
ncbi:MULTISPECIES: hypothetical protein [unclassified Rathayibacter]|uniref:hypothetical protein n=1 Tax=unclassified Rathayibacter TaxID=2609250 RepID=UPI0006F85AC7|nr:MULTISPECIES: hypothetical protein [unclassified Rathayibacter]KQQ06064.1 hypothetical protein ASF42_05935 [Rathayibacter sp. Leaf294]KQS13921.1 hypothetical protein ASG06_05945 [Rathayibacter sp. Leaf185]